jgi:hypothetical protein
MARIGVSITKSVAFRNSTQEFSNVYYYNNGGGALPDEAAALAIIDEVVATEKTFHAATVTFVRGRLWSQVGTPATNNMIAQKNLTGTGARAANSMDKERAFLLRIRAGADSRGNPVYLRKWYHACGEFVLAQGTASAILENTSGWTQAQRDAQAGQVNPIKILASGGNQWNLCAKGGRNFDFGANFQAHQYLEHHQLGDQWRAQ